MADIDTSATVDTDRYRGDNSSMPPQQPQKPPSMKTMLLMKRRMSIWKRGTPMSSNSQPAASAISIEPTYRLAPSSKFNTHDTEQAMLKAMKYFLASQPRYEADKCARITRLLVDDIKQRVKQLDYRRYKIVVHIVIGQKCEQDMLVASRAVWDAKLDNMASVTYSVKDIVATATVFATYFD